MKNFGMVAIAILAAVLMAGSVWAQPGPGRMHGGWGWREGNVPPEKYRAYSMAWGEFNESTKDLRQKILVKQHEMAALLAEPATDKEKLLAKQAEMQPLVNELHQKQLEFVWEFYKKNPEMGEYAYWDAMGPAMCGLEGPMMGPGGGWMMGPGGAFGPGLNRGMRDPY